jgi:hypothetical protein
MPVELFLRSLKSIHMTMLVRNLPHDPKKVDVGVYRGPLNHGWTTAVTLAVSNVICRTASSVPCHSLGLRNQADQMMQNGGIVPTTRIEFLTGYLLISNSYQV